MRYFTDRHLHRLHARGPLFELLRALPADSDQPAPSEALAQVFKPVEEPAEAEIAVLPLTWNEYVRRKQVAEAVTWIREAQRYGLPVLSGVTGDRGVTPPIPEIHVFRASGYASTRLPHQHSIPFFLTDPLLRFFDRKSPRALPYSTSPRVGFCGQVSASLLVHGSMALRTLARNLAYDVGFSGSEPQDVYPHLRLRHRVLQLLERSEGIDTKFIRRDRYRGGAGTPEAMARTTREYYDNIDDSDYVVCMRGGGNFSTRLYETLAMGRIPIFIDTDCTLPFDEVFDWRSLMPWVSVDDLEDLPAVLKDFHAQRGPDGLLEAQLRCRQLWEERLTRDGYFLHLRELLEAPAWPQREGS